VNLENRATFNNIRRLLNVACGRGAFEKLRANIEAPHPISLFRGKIE